MKNLLIRGLILFLNRKRECSLGTVCFRETENTLAKTFDPQTFPFPVMHMYSMQNDAGNNLAGDNFSIFIFLKGTLNLFDQTRVKNVLLFSSLI